jgi:tetratricopeptide (TPR) repeat protein
LFRIRNYNRRIFSICRLLSVKNHEIINCYFYFDFIPNYFSQTESTGSRVNMYGDARPLTLPNSKFRVNMSSLWHQNMIELDRRQWTSPQVSAALTFSAYAKNIDPAMEAVLNYKPRPTITELVRADFEAGNIAAVKAKLIEFRNDPANEFVSVEAELNAAGYRLMAAQRTAQAIEIFKLNTELYPDSANVYDSYGEALANAGKREEAIKAYEKALQIAPGYPSAVEALQRLKGQK